MKSLQARATPKVGIVIGLALLLAKDPVFFEENLRFKLL